MNRTIVRAGVGGWVYDDWRDNFYPAGWPRRRELEFASRHLGAIEINSTFHGTQKRESFAKWAAEAPEGFVFSVKASRYATSRRVLAEAGESIGRFLGSGLDELGPKLGPIVWQFAPTKRFDTDDFAAFLALLPKKLGRLPLRHALEVRHETFRCAEYLALARAHGCATVFTDSDKHPSFADLTGDFVYARLMRSRPDEPGGYPPKELAAWAKRAALWRDGGEPAGLPRVAPAAKSEKACAPRDVFVFFINGAKERAPHAAMGLIERLK